jgi:hypothetical protein
MIRKCQIFEECGGIMTLIFAAVPQELMTEYV